MYQMIDCKDMVLQILWDGNKANRLMSELRISLFVAAAYKATATNHPHPQCLMPFPSCFFNPKTKAKEFKELLKAINSIPKLNDITDDTTLPSLTWELLYWVLTNPLTIQPITKNIGDTIQQLRTNTGLPDIPIPDNRVIYVFETLPSKPKAEFLKLKEEFGSSFAYHGSKLENFHSIIHRGLVGALNVRSSYGAGTYLSTALKLSKGYSDMQVGWKNCGLEFGRTSRLELERLQIYDESGIARLRAGLRCIAVVEVVNHPTIVKVDHGNGLFYYVVSQDDWMQLAHLIVYTEGR